MHQSPFQFLELKSRKGQDWMVIWIVCLIVFILLLVWAASTGKLINLQFLHIPFGG